MLQRTDSLSIIEPESSQLRFCSSTNFDVNFIISLFLFRAEYNLLNISTTFHYLLLDFQIDSTSLLL